jgi:hypothetical protein
MDLDTPLGTLTFDSILDDLSHGAQEIPAGLLAVLIGWTSYQGIGLTPMQLRELLAILPTVSRYMEIIRMDGCRTFRLEDQDEDPIGLQRLSQSLDFIGSVMGGNTPGSQKAPPGSKLRRAGSRLRTIGHVTGHISSALQQLQPEISSDDQDFASDVIDI